MKEAADALRQKIYDYLFFTSARDVFSIASQGYYPQGPTQLGGAATPSERPVLRVSGSGRIYLRAVTKSSYTGSMWIDETGGRRYLWSSPRWQNLRSQTFDLTLPNETIAANLLTKTVTVTMLSDSASSLFVPQRIRELSVGSGIVPYFNAGSEIFATRNLTSGDTWTATYVDLTAGQSGLAELIDAGAQLTDAQYEDIRKLYTGLPVTSNSACSTSRAMPPEAPIHPTKWRAASSRICRRTAAIRWIFPNRRPTSISYRLSC